MESANLKVKKAYIIKHKTIDLIKKTYLFQKRSFS